MEYLVFIAAVAFLTRLDGWGPETHAQALTWPKWKLALAETSNAWTCGALSGLVALLVFGDIGIALMAGLGFVLWRAPHLGTYWRPDFINWPLMFGRGAITTLPTFVALSGYLHEHVFWGWLCLPMGVAQMLFYNGLQRFNRDVKPISWFHLAAEIGTGAIFAACITLIGMGI